MAKTVTVIPATINPLTRLPAFSIQKRRTAGYARVSTDKDEQFTSYEAQVDYYTKFIKEKPEWEFVKVYTDEHVIIGTSGENLVKSRGSALVPISFLLRDKPKSFKSLKIINERL